MKDTTREERIIQMLKRENGLPIRTIARELGVSHMTVRRDLEQLTSKNQVKLIHGGVILTSGNAHTQNLYSLNNAEAVQTEQKRRIGELAAGLIEPDDTLIIDTGSTTEFLARNITDGIPLTIICYALNIISITAGLRACRQVFAGGVLHQNSLMFESPEGIELIRRHRATKAFISAAGVHTEFGVTCLNMYERGTKQAAIESSDQKILLADSTKFGQIRSDYFGELSNFDAVVTDTGIPDEFAQAIRELGITLYVA